jgi:subtilisin family serine protease
MDAFYRSSHRIYLALGALLLALAVMFGGFHTARAASISSDVTTPSLLVHFEEGTTPEAAAALLASQGFVLVRWMPQIAVAEVRPLAINPEVATAGVSSLSDALMSTVGAEGAAVTHVEADAMVSAAYMPAYMPNDPDFSDLTMSYALHHVRALDAWEIVTGTPEIVIAVLDSGVRADHPEFAGRLLPGYDFVNEDDNPEDDSGHGTHVAGIMAAAMNNGMGIAGVCPNCSLLPVKVLNQSNLGSWWQLAQGIIFAVDNGAQVLNLSLGSVVPSATLERAIDYAFEHGAIVIAAAGNQGSDEPFYPAAIDGVIGVGAITSKGTLWSKSNYGSYVDLVAPGELIYSTYYDLNNIYRGYTFMNGTSMAASFVSGVAGLLLTVAPDLSAEDVTSALILGTTDLGVAGWEPQFGYGNLNAMGSLRAPVAGLLEALGELDEPNSRRVTLLPWLTSN